MDAGQRGELPAFSKSPLRDFEKALDVPLPDERLWKTSRLACSLRLPSCPVISGAQRVARGGGPKRGPARGEGGVGPVLCVKNPRDPEIFQNLKLKFGTPYYSVGRRSKRGVSPRLYYRDSLLVALTAQGL